MNEDKKINKTQGKRFNTKKLKYGTLSIVVTVIVIAAVVLFNVIVGVLSEKQNLNIDLTSQQFYEISPETEDFLRQITQKIEITVMADEMFLNNGSGQYASWYKQAYEIMKKFPQSNPNITLRFVDLTLHPEELNRFASVYQGSIESGSIVVSLLDDEGNPVRVKVGNILELFNAELDYQRNQYVISSSKAEQVLSTFVIYVTDVKPMKAYVMSLEMAEMDSISNIESLLSTNGYDTQRWNPNNPMPTDMDLLVIDNPLNDFTEKMIDDIYKYLENDGNYGKNLVYLANNAQKETPNFNTFLNEWGLSVRQGTMIGENDPQNLLTTQSLYWFKTNINTNDYTEGVSNTNLPVAVYAPSPIDILFPFHVNITTTDLLDTADTAFIVDDEFLTALEDDPSLTPETGTFSVMALSSKHTFDDDHNMIKSNILVIGSSEMMTSQVTSSSLYSNAEYFLSTVNVMTGKTNSLVIAPKADSTNTFAVNQERYNTAYVIFMMVLPLCVLIIGAVVLLRRRHK
ncbi:MAG: GldG family protein [Ruminococcus sp.]|jgi:hypothetical protein|nr:GldG family protein [Ruminococcus sp.]